MKKYMFCFILCICSIITYSQSGKTTKLDSLYDLALTDLSAFSHHIVKGASSEMDKAEKVVDWFARHFDWTSTDYKKRTITEILERKGGNCNELAMVTSAAFETIGLKMRRIREINLHVLTDRRQESAEKKVKELGNRASVFGRQHNDHVWLEIYNTETGGWIPADPSLGVVGYKKWLAARYSFGARYSLDPSSEDMIAPFAIFAEENGQWVNRTAHYAIEGFNALYQHQLAQYPAWENWCRSIRTIEEKALGAFMGETNLHTYSKEISELSNIYQTLKTNVLGSDFGQIHQSIENFSQFLIDQNIDEVVNSYTEEAKIFPTRGNILAGHDAIRKYWTPSPSQTSKTSYHKIWPEEIRIIGDEAYDYGYYEGKTLMENGEEVSWDGKYVIVWKKTKEGQWKMYLDIWNRL